MVIANKNSRKRLFHNPNCKYAKLIKKDNVIYFETKAEARNSGYMQCTHCSQILKIYYKDREEIDKFIHAHTLKMYFEDGCMYIDNFFSSWKIVPKSKGFGVILYHANTETYIKLKKRNGHLIHTYHKQNYKGKNDILSILHYIIEHDEWKQNELNSFKDLPKTTKNQRKAYNKAKQKAKKIQTRNVYNLLDRLRLEKQNKGRH